MSGSSGTGVGQNSLNQSTETFTTALVLQAAIAAGEIAAFAIIFKRFRKVYEPRTFLPRPGSIWRWIPAIINADARQIIPRNGLDAYMFLRLWFFGPVTVISWIIVRRRYRSRLTRQLFPVDAANSGGNQEGVSKLTFGNIGKTPAQQRRYAAHVILLYLFTFYLLYLIRREMSRFVDLRHEWLVSKEHTRLAQSRTVLLTGIPREYQSVDALTRFATWLGDVERVWIMRDEGKELPDFFDRRNAACNKLEAAETKLIRMATADRIKADKAAAKAKKQDAAKAPARVDPESELSVADQLIERPRRPTHRVSKIPLPFFGNKVDSIEWAKEEIALCNRELEERRAKIHELKPAGAAFILFERQIDAHMFQQCTNHHLPLRMSGRFLEVAPDDVNWSALSINPYQQQARRAISYALTAGLILLWAFPVAFVALISNVSYLCEKASWLAWLCKLPAPVNGIIQGVLPPAALAVLFMLLPIVLRLFAKFEGIPLNSAIERSLMTRYFIFLFIHGFIIVTLASGLVASIPLIANNPGSAVTLLATQLPLASTFFLTYIVTVGFGGAAGALLQVATLVLGFILIVLLGSTPRKLFNLKSKMPSSSFGTLWPNMSLVMVIGITYSVRGASCNGSLTMQVIAPLINGFAFLAFGLFWFAYKYLFIWVQDQPAAGETGGLFYPSAIGHVFAALYIQLLCMTGLFFLARDVNDAVSALPEAIFTIILIVIVALFNYLITSSYEPLYRNLPISLAEKAAVTAKSSPQPELGRGNGIVYDGAPSQFGFGAEKRPPTDRDESAYPPQPAGAEKGMFTTTTSPKQNLLVDDGGADPHAFDQPALFEPQRPIWLPRDDLGIAADEVAHLRSLGIDASTDGAFLTAKGKVEVNRSPPEDDWTEDDKVAAIAADQEA